MIVKNKNYYIRCQNCIYCEEVGLKKGNKVIATDLKCTCKSVGEILDDFCYCECYKKYIGGCEEQMARTYEETQEVKRKKEYKQVKAITEKYNADNVNHPKHYADSCSIECIDAMVMTFGAERTAEYCVQNAYKYAWRHKYKNRLEDLKKAEWYLDKFDELVTWCETKFSADGEIETKYLELGQFLRGMIETERKEYESGKRNK